MVLRLIKGVGIWEDEHLGVGVDGDVELNYVLVSAQKVGHSLRLGLRLRKRPAVDFLARILRGSLNWAQQRHVTLWKLQRPLHDQRVRPHMRKKKGKGKLTAPIDIKVSVEVNANAKTQITDGTVLPPPPSLNLKNKNKEKSYIYLK